MKKTLLLFFISYSFFAQEKDNSQQINLLNSNYKDFVLNQDKIFSITKNDSLIVWNYKNDSILLIKENVLAIAKNTKNEIYIASRNEIKNLSSSKLISSTQDSIYNILFDKKDNLIAITSKAVNYKNKRYFPPKYTSFYRCAGDIGAVIYGGV